MVHRAILKMVARCFPRVLVHHSPNGAHLAGGPAARFKQVGALLGDGMMRGFPDIICLWSPGVGAMLEVKRPKLGRVSLEQEAVHGRLEEIRWPVAVVTSVEQAFEFLRLQGAPWSGIEP